jgi:hypothetical protein
MMITITALLWLLVIAVVAKWVFAPPDRTLPERAQRTEAELARVREEIDRLTGEVHRLSEEQSFMVRLLSEGDRARLEGRELPPPPPSEGQGG